MVDFRTDLFRGHMRAHDLLRKSGGSTLVIVRAARALRHKRSAPSIARGARPPVICAGSTPFRACCYSHPGHCDLKIDSMILHPSTRSGDAAERPGEPIGSTLRRNLAVDSLQMQRRSIVDATFSCGQRKPSASPVSVDWVDRLQPWRAPVGIDTALKLNFGLLPAWSPAPERPVGRNHRCSSWT
jgi:hypothetical protein